MSERTVVLGVSGSIAAYKAVDLASKLTQAGIKVRVVMTEAATKLVGEASFRAITGLPVSTSMFELTNPFSIEHISLSEAADVFVIAPCTANVMAKLANGLADDLLTCTALATRAPILIAPAMHTAMWENPATQANLATLKERGARIVGPAVGRLASGGFGAGRFVPVEDVIDAIRQILGRDGDLKGRRIVVTAGGTQEPLDPVRFLGNRSSGKMGYAVAEVARDRGASVTLISAPSSLRRPTGIRVVEVRTAVEMRDAVEEATTSTDALIMAAAVADLRPAQGPANEKIKKRDLLGNDAQDQANDTIRKTEDGLTLELARTPDILAETDGPYVRVGFAAETADVLENARKKLVSKRLDLIVANDVSATDAGFGSDDNRCVLIDAEGSEELGLLPKIDVAHRILDRTVAALERR